MASAISRLGLLLSCATTTLALPSSHVQRADVKPAAFVLTGDSTTAHGGGWGDGFVSDALKAPAIGTNLGHNGATTVSFRAMGDWDTALFAISHYKPNYDVYVTIQFGHNDQKESANITIDQYASNLATMASEVKAAGGTPILVTPLTRRTFSGKPARVVENLSKERNATLSTATKTNTWFIDLNKASTDYVNAIGQEEADKYDEKEGDRTHLNAHGGVVFGRIVVDLLVGKYAVLEGAVKKDANLTETIAAGRPA